jgi:type IV pilus assembly protein PilV
MVQLRENPSFQQGVVLLESLIAILIFSLGVLGIVGLQASMIKNTSDAKYRSDAAYIAQQRIGQMWADPGNLADYLEDDTDISTLLPSGTRTVELDASGQYVVTVTWQQPGGSEHNYIAIASIAGG